MKTLDEIGIEQQTDKASQFSRTYAKPHNYLTHLAKFFDPIREKSIRFVEIGVGGGESIRTWIEFFPNAEVIGVDNVQATNPWNTVGSGVHERYRFVYGDQSDKTFWACFVADYGSEFDVLIDDGGHHSHQVMTTLNCMWCHVASGGLYIMEDLACSYSPIFMTAGWPTPMDRLRDEIDSMNRGQDEIDSMYFAREICIIRKR
jgi:hypothetical protein